MSYKFKIDQDVIFIKKSNRIDAWNLDQYELYKIDCHVITNKQKYYSVIDKNGRKTSWFIEEDFINLKEYRKLKLNKLNNIYNEV